MKFKTYKLGKEFASIETELTSEIAIFTSSVPQLLPLSHTKESLKTYLDKQVGKGDINYSKDFNWNDLELIEIYLIEKK